LGEYGGFPETVCEAVVALHVLKKPRFLSFKYVEELILHEAGVNVSFPVDVEYAFPAFTIEVRWFVFMKPYYILDVGR